MMKIVKGEFVNKGFDMDIERQKEENLAKKQEKLMAPRPEPKV